MNPRWIVLVLIAAMVGGVVASGNAAAHAQYLSSNPAANAILPNPVSEISIILSEPVQAGTGAIRVTNTTGARVDMPPVASSPDGRTISVGLAAIGPGIYTVAWSAVSVVDGHFTAGSFAFAVQNPDGSLPGVLPSSGPTTSESAVSPVEVALRFIGFLGLSIALGVAVLGNFMWLPAGRDPDVRASRAYGLGFQVLWNVGRIAAFAFATSMVGLFVIATGLEGTSAAQGLLASSYVQSVVLRLAFAVGLFMLLSRALVRARNETPESVAWTVEGCLLLAVAGLLAGSFGTHAAADPVFAAVGVAANAAHLAGVGLWVGGLAGIVAVRGLLREADAVPLARIVFGRFSRLAGYAVVLVLAGGLILSLLLVRTWEALLGTSYGWVVLGKVALFAPMVAFGAYNRYRLIPETSNPGEPAVAVQRLVRNVRAETGFGVLVLVLAGLLTAMTPAASLALGGPNVLELQTTAGGLRIDFKVIPYPNLPGEYTVEFLLNNATTGQAYYEGRNGTAIFTHVITRVSTTATLSGPHGNHLFVNVELSRPGIWRIDATFARFDGPDVSATFHIAIRGGG